MAHRRLRPIPRLDVSLEALPPPEGKRTCRLNLSLTAAELAMIEQAARERGEQPAAFCRTVLLTVFQNSALRAMQNHPNLMEKSAVEQQRILLEAFAIK